MVKFALLILIICPMFSAEEPSPLPPDAVKLIAAADKEVSEIEAKALTAKNELYNALIPKLTKAQEAATKAGKLEASMAVKAKIDDYKTKIAEISALKPATKRLSTSKDVTLYALPNFKGPNVTIKQFDTVLDVYKVGFPNDALRSLRLPPGYIFVVYAAEQAGGESYEIDEESPDLTGTPAGGMSSFMIKRVK